MIMRLLGLLLVAGSLGLLWYAKPNAQGKPRFGGRHRDLIETYLTVAITTMLGIGVVLLIVGAPRSLINQ